MPSLLVATDLANLVAAISGAGSDEGLAGRVATAAQVLINNAGPVALTPTVLGLLACDATLTTRFHRRRYTTKPRTVGPVMTTAPPAKKPRRRRRAAGRHDEQHQPETTSTATAGDPPGDLPF